MEMPERTNEITGVYANQCVELAKELQIPYINLWSLMQEFPGWQKKFLRLVGYAKFMFTRLLLFHNIFIGLWTCVC